MERSLSALLPVHNAQSTLAATVREFLEILPELTRSFEVVIADDGSTDATIEVADELARYYPQVVAVRWAVRRGRVAALRTALERSSGEILLLKDDACKLPLDAVLRLWRAMDEQEIVVGCGGPSPESRRPARREPGAEARGGLQMLTRRAIEPILGALSDQTTLLAALAEQGLAWHRVEIADRPHDQPPRPIPALAGRLFRLGNGAVGQPARTDSASAAEQQPKRPNYLDKLKDFALGE